MAVSVPVFYDCEASDVEGYPIEIGWAFLDPEARTVVSESHLIRPPDDWPIKESWDRAAERPCAEVGRGKRSAFSGERERLTRTVYLQGKNA